MTNEEANAAVAALTNAEANQPCPRCKNEKFTLLRTYFSLLAIVEKHALPNPEIPIGPRFSVPCIGVICDRCGYLSMHVMRPLGLLSVPTSTPSGVSDMINPTGRSGTGGAGNG